MKTFEFEGRKKTVRLQAEDWKQAKAKAELLYPREQWQSSREVQPFNPVIHVLEVIEPADLKDR